MIRHQSTTHSLIAEASLDVAHKQTHQSNWHHEPDLLLLTGPTCHKPYPAIHLQKRWYDLYLHYPRQFSHTAIRLFPANHPNGEGEVKHPGESDEGIEPQRIESACVLDDPFGNRPSENGDGGVKREEVGREGNDEVVAVGQDVAALG